MSSVSSALAVPLSLCFLAGALGASPSKAAPASFAADRPVHLASSAPADTLPEKKERVPKSNPDTRERGAGAAKADGDDAAVEEKKEGGFFDRCITDLFMGLLFRSHDDETPKVA